MARAGDKFSIAAVCAEAGVDRPAFRRSFAGKAALLAALAQLETQPDETPAQAEPLPEPPVEPKVVQEPGVSTPDAWLERRLRVFERALAALETKQEAMARDHATALADMEDKLAKFGMRREEIRARLTADAMAPALPEYVPDVCAVPEMPEFPVCPPEPEPSAFRPLPDALASLPQPIVVVPRDEMADVLQTARGKIRPANEDIAPDRNARLRWLAIGGLSLVALFICAGLTFGRGNAQNLAMAGSGETHRQVAANPLLAKADAGDPVAQVKLALAYLRGEGVAEDKQAAARWSASAAQAGQPVAQYLAGALSDDKVRAYHLFSDAAAKGNLKAMHNLAIAYAQGDGTKKDEAKAAEWFARAAERGYIDSAFDLGVLYERGQGVGQDLKQALKWYAVAAFAGDKPSQERVAVLRGQMNAYDVKLAMAAAGSFAPLPSNQGANAL